MSSLTPCFIRRRAFRLAPLLSLLGLLAVGCDRSRETAPLDLRIYFTGDARGRLEPCGCFDGQYGGLSRVKTVLAGESSPNTLRLDIGDAAGGREDYDLIQYRYMLRAFAAMKYDALNIGQREARFSLAQLREIKSSATVPILGANLLDKSAGQPVFDSFRVVRRGDYRIGIIGVVDPRGLGDELGTGLEIGPVEPAISRCLAALQGQADEIILLAFTDEETMSRLARQFYEIHLILGGKVAQPSQELKKENRSLIYFVTNESRALGILRLQLSRGAQPKPLSNEIGLVHDKIPEDPAIQQLAQDYRDEIRATRLAVDDPNYLEAGMVPGARATPVFAGTESCLRCHPAAAAVWSRSGHANAFAALVRAKADADPKCVTCHTVGFGRPSGYQRSFGADKLTQVGCESCHGPGGLHVRQREGDASINFTFRPLDAGDCAKCHFGEFSRPFHWDEFWPKIQHGREPRQASAQKLVLPR
jgi:hypothetical protein